MSEQNDSKKTHDGTRTLHSLVRQIAPAEQKAWLELYDAKFAFAEGQTEEQAQRFVDAAKDYAELVSKLTKPNVTGDLRETKHGE